MEAKKYGEIIAQTAVYPRRVDNFGVAYAFLGMYDELQEVNEKIKIGDESGAHTERFDVVWYVCAMCEELKIDFSTIVQRYFETRESNSKAWSEGTEFYFGKIKKFYRDGKAIDNEHITEHFLLPCMDMLFENYDQEKFKEGLQENYEKLMSRRKNGTIHGDGDKR